jgi:hypothetical protein
MARSTASIQTEITALEAAVVKATSSVSADGVSVTYDLEGIRKRLDVLYQQLDRASGDSPMIVRGVVKGLR